MKKNKYLGLSVCNCDGSDNDEDEYRVKGAVMFVVFINEMKRGKKRKGVVSFDDDDDDDVVRRTTAIIISTDTGCVLYMCTVGIYFEEYLNRCASVNITKMMREREKKSRYTGISSSS